MRAAIFATLLAGVACAASSFTPSDDAPLQTWPNLNTKTLVYTPFAHGIDPRTEDIYRDGNKEIFRRDVRVINDLGVGALVLEPWNQEASHHQALYNATNFEESPHHEDDPVDSRLSNSSVNAIGLIPSIPFTPAMYNHLFEQASSNPQRLELICSRVKTFVRHALSPAPPDKILPGGTLKYGGGHPGSKRNTKGFNLQLHPNDDTVWGGLDFKLQADSSSAFNLFAVVEEMAGCAQAEMSKHDIEGRNVFLSIADIPCKPGEQECDKQVTTAVGFIKRYEEYLSLDPIGSSNVTGFIVQTSRTRGCGASSLVEAVLETADSYAHRFRDGNGALVWFTAGVDRYDDNAKAPYRTAYDELDPVTGTYTFSDKRTHCLLQLITSIDTACGNVQSSSRNGCGLVVHEYADSYWRSGYVGKSNAADFLGQVCGNPDPEDSSFLTEQYACGEASICEGAIQDELGSGGETNASLCTERKQAEQRSPPISVHDLPPSRFPGYLQCDISATDKRLEKRPFHLPWCTTLNVSELDTFHNHAWDGLMEMSLDEDGLCSDRYSEAGLTLRPTRAFYALMHAFGQQGTGDKYGESKRPDQKQVTLFSELRGDSGRKRSKELETSRFIEHWPRNLVIYFIVLWTCNTALKPLLRYCKALVGHALGAALVSAFALASVGLGVGMSMTAPTASYALGGLVVGALAGAISHAGEGRLTFYLTVWVLWMCTRSTLEGMQMHCIIVGMLWDLVLIGSVFVLWCPLNGGGGGGGWWWCHFSFFLLILTFNDADPTYHGDGQCDVSYPILTALWSVMRLAAVHRSMQNPLLALPWDPCSASKCCVRKIEENGGYFPWSPRVTIPAVW